jgi:uncharacterized membrane protein
MGKLTKKLMRLWMLPFWIAWPLVLLGAWYVLVFPFGLDWFGYGISIAFAVAFAAWARPRYRVTVLERSDRGVVYWVRRVKKGEEKAQEQPPPATDSPSRLDQPFPSAEALRRSGAPAPS